MISGSHRRYILLVLVFAFCQVIGAMCAFPDLSLAENSVFVEDMAGMSCPMYGSGMCPPSATSSPGREVKTGVAIDVDHSPIAISFVAVLTTPAATALCTSGSAYSIVLISVASPSVLRI